MHMDMDIAQEQSHAQIPGKNAREQIGHADQAPALTYRKNPSLEMFGSLGPWPYAFFFAGDYGTAPSGMVGTTAADANRGRRV